MQRFFLFFAFLMCTTILYTSCKKEQPTDTLSDSLEDLGTDQDDLEAIDLDADQIIEERGGGPCPTLTWANTAGTFPNTITIDFGAACTRPDGRLVSGKIIVAQSDEMNVTGATRRISFQDFNVDDVQIEGTRLRTNEGPDALGNPVHTVTVANVKRRYPDGTSTSRSAEHTFTWVAGSNTPLIRLDDAFEITGYGVFSGRNGNKYQTTIVTPLLKRFTCRWIVSGVLEISKPAKGGEVNFGNGDCDRQAVITGPNGGARTILLRK
jgi:hypothetical protein